MTLLVARLLIVCMTLLTAVVARAQVPDDIKIGAIRWDAWYEGAPDQKVLEQPEWKHRAPFFARYDASGALHLDGDKEHVIHAEVAYARAIGLDYFIFGFYPDTGSWGRQIDSHLKLNRALSTYLRLPDRMGVKFAISLNQLFPANDIEDIASSVATFASHQDYVRTPQGTLPIFILAHDGLDWKNFFGTDEKAREAFRVIRRMIRSQTNIDVTFIIMNYEHEKAMHAASTYGLDMVSTYTSFAPGTGSTKNTFATCAMHGEAIWAKAAAADIPYAPNITLGWDNRIRKTTHGNMHGKPPGPWCARPERQELAQHFKRAATHTSLHASQLPFPTIVVYAWNEYAEGGWMAPNLEDGSTWLADQRSAIGRNRRLGPVELTWPLPIESATCPLRTAEKPRQRVEAGCSPPPPPANNWPCPPGTNLTSDRIRAPSGYESMIWSGGWNSRTCQ